MSDDSYINDESNTAQQSEIYIDDLSLSLSQKEIEREALEAQMHEFLAKGGAISHIAQNVLGDPPKKPQSNYGGQPI